MRKLCPNLDREDGLETVLEVPIPEEIFTPKTPTTTTAARAWHNMKSWIKPTSDHSTSPPLFRDTEIQLLLGVVGAPLIPFPITPRDNQPIIKDQHIEASMAKYIVKQYVAAVGGERALNSVESMYAMGQVRMGTSEFGGAGEVKGKKTVKVNKQAKGENMGGFVVWQKRPELWCLELVVSGYKISAGSDGKVAWRQTPWHHSHASRGPPRPLRRFLQVSETFLVLKTPLLSYFLFSHSAHCCAFPGLDPRSTANLFTNSICIGERRVKNEDCFVLKLEAEATSLRARSSNNVEIIRHTMWGYFSQRTGLLVQLEDSHMLRIKGTTTSYGNDGVYWETSMESVIEEYRNVDGISIAHKGKSWVSLFRFGEGPGAHSRTRMEEVWEIEEVGFNIKGLSMDCFLPPSDLRKEKGECGVVEETSHLKLPYKIRSASFRISASKVAAIHDVDEEEEEEDCFSSETDQDF
ncbi:uncharacterized protein G2W53_013329 [Senna tora]|uniref:Uncharacterized protein n=1 Tax=Senna tora TaxID=362788 RepID=A0A834U2C6_9FABA|nr:uncharacterized protein G2W53_013329 [Senna tora]